MGKNVADMHREAIAKYGTGNNKFSDFSIGSRVKVITPCCDFYFFYEETGVVAESTNKYLGVAVKFDKPRIFKDGDVQEGFSFDPEDLLLLEKNLDTASLFDNLEKKRKKIKSIFD